MISKPIAFILAILTLVILGAPLVQAQSPDLTGKVIILDAGHGASTTNKYAGYDEQATMLKLAEKIGPLLKSRGATVRFTRTGVETVPIASRTAMINIWSLEAIKNALFSEPPYYGSDRTDDLDEIDRLIAIMQSIIDNPDENGSVYMNTPFMPERPIHPDLRRIFEIQGKSEISREFLVISLHSNAPSRPTYTSVNGATSFYISNSHKNTSNYYTGYSFGEYGRYFGDILLNNISNIGIRRRNNAIENYFMIREHNLPGVLVENGFHTNESDRAKLSDDAFLDSLALAYLDAITDYFSDLPLTASESKPIPNQLYSDVQIGAWYYEAVQRVSECGLIIGTGESMFSPNMGMTRSMLVTVISRLGNANVSGYETSPYQDVDIGAWYGKQVAWAAESGVIGFIDADVFNPHQDATREEIALMIYNYLIWTGLEPPDLTAFDVFADDADISERAKPAVYTLREYGVMQGDNTTRFNPEDTATRAEVAQIFYNILSRFEV